MKLTKKQKHNIAEAAWAFASFLTLTAIIFYTFMGWIS